MASMRSLTQLVQFNLTCMSGCFEPEVFNVGCLSCLDTLVLYQVVPKAVEFPMSLKVLDLTGNAETIEGVSWLNPQVPLRALGLTSNVPLSDKMRGLLHDIRHSLMERFSLESTCAIAAPVQHFSMGCTLRAAEMLPHFQALKDIRISTHGNVSIVIPAVSALENMSLSADMVEISIENLNSFAARMRIVISYANNFKEDGIRILQTLRTSGDFVFIECIMSNPARRKFYAKRKES